MNIKLIIIILLIVLIIFLFLNNNKNEHAGNVPLQESRIILPEAEAEEKLNIYDIVPLVFTRDNLNFPKLSVRNITVGSGIFSEDISGNNLNLTGNLNTKNINNNNDMRGIDNTISGNLESDNFSITRETIFNKDFNGKSINVSNDSNITGILSGKKIEILGDTQFNGDLNTSVLNCNNVNLSNKLSGRNGIFSGNISGNNASFNDDINSNVGIFGDILTGNNGNFTNEINGNRLNTTNINTKKINVTGKFISPGAKFNNFLSDNSSFGTMNVNGKIFGEEETSIDNLNTNIIYTDIFNTKNFNLTRYDTNKTRNSNNGITSETFNYKDINVNNVNDKKTNITDNIIGKFGIIDNLNSKSITTPTINSNNINAKILIDNTGLQDRKINTTNLTTNNMLVNELYVNNNQITTSGDNKISLIDETCFSNSPNKSSCINVNMIDSLIRMKNNILHSIPNFTAGIFPSDLGNIRNINLYKSNSRIDLSDNCILWNNDDVRRKLLASSGLITLPSEAEDLVFKSARTGDMPYVWDTSKTSGQLIQLTNNKVGNHPPNAGNLGRHNIYTSLFINSAPTSTALDDNLYSIEIKVPIHPNASQGQEYSVLWIQLLNDRWSSFKLHTGQNSPIPNKSFGKYVGGRRRGCVSFPNPDDPNNVNDTTNYHWIPMPFDITGITDRKIKLSIFWKNPNIGIFFTQMAFTTNPYNHCLSNAVSLHWQVNKLNLTGIDYSNANIGWCDTCDFWSGSHEPNFLGIGNTIPGRVSDSITKLAMNVDILIRMPFVNKGNNKIFYLSEYFYWNTQNFYKINFHIKDRNGNYKRLGYLLPINNLNREPNPVELFYTNALLNHRYYGITIPKTDLPEKGTANDNFFEFRINIEYKNIQGTVMPDTVMYVKEMGTYDEI